MMLAAYLIVAITVAINAYIYCRFGDENPRRSIVIAAIVGILWFLPVVSFLGWCRILGATP